MFSIQDGLPLGGEDRGGVQDFQVPPARDQLPEVIPSAASGCEWTRRRGLLVRGGLRPPDCHHLVKRPVRCLEGYKLVWELRGEDVEIRPNSMASKWEDLETLIGKEKILVFTPDGDEVLNPFFREKLEAERANNGWLGASVRWAVQGTARGSLRLVLQGLPMERGHSGQTPSWRRTRAARSTWTPLRRKLTSAPADPAGDQSPSCSPETPRR